MRITLRKNVPISEIVDTAASIERFKRKDVRLCKVDDVNTIAHAGPILSRIIRPKNHSMLTLA